MASGFRPAARNDGQFVGYWAPGVPLINDVDLTTDAWFDPWSMAISGRFSYRATHSPQAPADLTRVQFRLFNEIGESVQLTQDDRRRVLALSETEWAAWEAFIRNGPIPSKPSVPDMLRRLGKATFHLFVAAEGIGLSV